MAEEDKKDERTEGAEGEGAEGDAVPPKKSKRKLIILAALGGLIVLSGGSGTAFIMMHKSADETGKTKQEATNNEEKKASVYYPLGDLLVNLSGEGKHPNFLKVKISLELADEKDLPLMDAIKPRVIDNFQVYLRELRIEDLRGSAGMYRLREELLMRVTEAAQPVRIRDVLFQEMLVQ